MIKIEENVVKYEKSVSEKNISEVASYQKEYLKNEHPAERRILLQKLHFNKQKFRKFFDFHLEIVEH